MAFGPQPLDYVVNVVATTSQSDQMLSACDTFLHGSVSFARACLSIQDGLFDVHIAVNLHPFTSTDDHEFRGAAELTIRQNAHAHLHICSVLAHTSQ